MNLKELIENENYTKEVFVILSYNEIPSKKHAEVCYMCNKIGLEAYDLVDLLKAISNKDSEFDTYDIEYID